MESSETVAAAAVAVSTSDILRKIHSKEPQYAPIRFASQILQRTTTRLMENIDLGHEAESSPREASDNTSTSQVVMQRMG